MQPTERTVFFENTELTELNDREKRMLRKDMQIIFQDPYSSLDPRMKVQQIIAEPIKTHRLLMSKQEIKAEVIRLMYLVGLNEDQLNRYPHQLSGGQRQRIGIARALALKPKLIVADESVSALDVSIQSQILNLLKELRNKLDLTIVFISHDLSVVKHISDTVGVMYLGKIVEIASKSSIYKEALHPYTKALLSSVPVPDPLLKRDKVILEGDIPDPANTPSGCAFSPRCPFKMDICSKVSPVLEEAKENQFVACHLYDAPIG